MKYVQETDQPIVKVSQAWTTLLNANYEFNSAGLY